MADSVAPALRAPAAPRPAGGLKFVLSVLLGNWMGRTGLLILSVLLFIALFGPWISPYDASERTGLPFSSPSRAHWLGTNDIGQDILSELIIGTRVSLTIGFTAAALAILIGTLVGVTAGFLGGRTDSVLMRLVDVVMVLPFIPLMIVLAAFFGASAGNLIIAIALLIWARPARVIRSIALGIRNLTYIEGAQALGASNVHVLWKHVLPGVLPIAVSQFILAASGSILIEASLAFLGLGDPIRKSWGTVLYYAQIRGAFLNGSWPWWVIPPGMLISMAVLGFALTGRAIETALFPRLQQRS